jgi:hypothetical protein
MKSPEYIRVKGHLYRREALQVPSYKPAPSRGVQPRRPSAPASQRNPEQVAEAKQQMYEGLNQYLSQAQQMLGMQPAMAASLGKLTGGRSEYTENAYAKMEEAFTHLKEAFESFRAAKGALETIYK